MAKQMMNNKEARGWFSAVRCIEEIVKQTDFPAPTSVIRKVHAFGRRELRDMVRAGWLASLQIQNPQTGVIENGYYVKMQGGTVPSLVAQATEATEIIKKMDGEVNAAQPEGLENRQPVLKNRVLGCSVQVDHESTGEGRS